MHQCSYATFPGDNLKLVGHISRPSLFLGPQLFVEAIEYSKNVCGYDARWGLVHIAPRDSVLHKRRASLWAQLWCQVFGNTRSHVGSSPHPEKKNWLKDMVMECHGQIVDLFHVVVWVGEGGRGCWFLLPKGHSWFLAITLHPRFRCLSSSTSKAKEMSAAYHIEQYQETRIWTVYNKKRSLHVSSILMVINSFVL